MSKFRVTVPFVPDMGSIQSFVVSETMMQTKAQDALWNINKMRDHDGLPHLTRMPAGTRYERIKDAS
ncbi:hypothetical protein [Paraburkholderia sp. J8-2]|uniref:hypothetical protein n=1 Tax=Paraburkholderia sp. J8-2 TaxID=2805440 RepID=UPI002AB6A827|nr:hypothetical protein [Paraburkholderia sp. J8-2]